MKQYYGDIEKLKSSTDLEEVNKLIKNDWILIDAISSHEGLSFILGRLPKGHSSFAQG
ncbi:hypothetical protein [Vallitalea guaymasensis]|uniref:hypothetical protein n=1 Tax=Vallitalea guaymasensis TaxID=1185412 RepID=UPI00187D2355|nr:hypothetical protein [Vallitalea guaymasensis]